MTGLNISLIQKDSGLLQVIPFWHFRYGITIPTFQHWLVEKKGNDIRVFCDFDYSPDWLDEKGVPSFRKLSKMSAEEGLSVILKSKSWAEQVKQFSKYIEDIATNLYGTK